MFRKKHITVVVMLLSVILTMTGCSKTSETYSAEYKDGYMRVFHDGKVFATYVEDFDEDVYDKEELKTMVDNEIAEFNEKYSTDNGMALENFRVEDEEAKVRLSFKTIDDYILYNETYVNSDKVIKMFVGTYDEAVSSGYKITGKLKQEGKKDRIDAEELEEKTDTSKLYVVYITQGANIRVDGEIKYVNKHVKLEDNMAQTTDKSQNFILYALEDE